MCQSERGALLRPREFLLFSDYLLWLEGDATDAWDGRLGGANPSKFGGVGLGGNVSRLRPGARPHILRSRSRSEAELSALAARASPGRPKRMASSGTGEERWVYRGRAGLVDVDVVVPPAVEEDDELRFEVLSPEESFVVYAGEYYDYIACTDGC
jgi:FYVE/RhoGEF/PH domain-containing protein 5/6